MTLSEQKQQIRARIKSLLNQYSVEDLNNFSSKINSKILELIKTNNWQKIGLFAATNQEPNLWFLFDQLTSEESKVKFHFFFPRVNYFQKKLEFADIVSQKQLVTAHYGLLEPLAELPTAEPSTFDVIFIPGLAFDQKNNRLGRGKGYYDQFLATVPTTTIKVGVCFPFQMIDQVPVGENDQGMNLVVY